MSFLNAIMLGGAGAIAIPILIELLNRRKIQHVQWAAMQFLRNAINRNRKKLTLENLLLLLLRCLILLLLAFALARPVLPSGNAGFLGLSESSAVFIIDNSYSMQLSDGVQTRMDEARTAAEEIVDSLPSGSSGALLLATEAVNPIIPAPTRDLSLLRKSLRSFPASDSTSNFAPSLRAAMNTLESNPAAGGEIYLITDGQAVGWRAFKDILNTINEAQNRYQVYILFVGGGATEQNLGISTLRTDANLAAAGQPMRFEAEVTNFGSQPATDVPVTLAVNRSLPSSQVVISSLDPGTSQLVSLTTRINSSGYHTVTAALPGDRLPNDDTRAVALKTIEQLEILLVDGNPSPSPADSSTFFLQNALQPVPKERLADFFIKVETVNLANFNPAVLGRKDVVMFSDVDMLPQTAINALADFLISGGSAYFFTGPNVDTSFYNSTLLDSYAMMPAFMERAGLSVSPLPTLSFQESNFEHPIAAAWRDQAAGSLSTALFYNYHPLVPAPWPDENANPQAGAPSIILRYRDGSPAIMERSWGTGRVVLFNSTADTRWNDMPLRASFIPLLFRSLGYLIQRGDDSLNIPVGTPFTHVVDSRLVGESAVVEHLDPDVGFKQTFTIELGEKTAMLRTDPLRVRGAYEATINAQPPERFKFAVTTDPIESDLFPISPEQRGQLSEVAEVIDWQEGEDIGRQMQARRTGTELWPTIAMFILGLTIVETILAKRYSVSH